MPEIFIQEIKMPEIFMKLSSGSESKTICPIEAACKACYTGYTGTHLEKFIMKRIAIPVKPIIVDSLLHCGVYDDKLGACNEAKVEECWERVHEKLRTQGLTREIIEQYKKSIEHVHG